MHFPWSARAPKKRIDTFEKSRLSAQNSQHLRPSSAELNPFDPNYPYKDKVTILELPSMPSTAPEYDSNAALSCSKKIARSRVSFAEIEQDSKHGKVSPKATTLENTALKITLNRDQHRSGLAVAEEECQELTFETSPETTISNQPSIEENEIIRFSPYTEKIGSELSQHDEDAFWEHLGEKKSDSQLLDTTRHESNCHETHPKDLEQRRSLEKKCTVKDSSCEVAVDDSTLSSSGTSSDESTSFENSISQSNSERLENDNADNNGVDRPKPNDPVGELYESHSNPPIKQLCILNGSRARVTGQENMVKNPKSTENDPESIQVNENVDIKINEASLKKTEESLSLREKEIKDLATMIENLKEQNSLAEAAANLNIEHLNDSILILTNENKKLQEEKEETMNSLREQERLTEAAQSQISALNTDVKSLYDLQKSTEASFEQSKKQLNKLTEDLKEMEHKIRVAEESASAKSSDLQTTISRLKKDLIECKEEATKTLLRKNKEIERAVSRCTMFKESLNSSVTAHALELKKKDEEILDARRNLQEQQSCFKLAEVSAKAQADFFQESISKLEEELELVTSKLCHESAKLLEQIYLNEKANEKIECLTTKLNSSRSSQEASELLLQKKEEETNNFKVLLREQYEKKLESLQGELENELEEKNMQKRETFIMLKDIQDTKEKHQQSLQMLLQKEEQCNSLIQKILELDVELKLSTFSHSLEVQAKTVEINQIKINLDAAEKMKEKLQNDLAAKKLDEKLHLEKVVLLEHTISKLSLNLQDEQENLAEQIKLNANIKAEHEAMLANCLSANSNLEELLSKNSSEIQEKERKLQKVELDLEQACKSNAQLLAEQESILKAMSMKNKLVEAINKQTIHKVLKDFERSRQENDEYIRLLEQFKNELSMKKNEIEVLKGKLETELLAHTTEIGEKALEVQGLQLKLNSQRIAARAKLNAQKARIFALQNYLEEANELREADKEKISSLKLIQKAACQMIIKLSEKLREISADEEKILLGLIFEEWLTNKKLGVSQIKFILDQAGAIIEQQNGLICTLQQELSQFKKLQKALNRGMVPRSEKR
ncbi:hypothetical protein PUMCH_003544 [Australozyma saopauloensis]|uniref:Uncharacterized protein n=1 Tax=Australozyma saopauloensis TaxID=291208 RepID=A0AAX4HCR6_9ASCO|nr:hypothetical protein PUMCH_003544 [[Candida] saopauloensis]